MKSVEFYLKIAESSAKQVGKYVQSLDTKVIYSKGKDIKIATDLKADALLKKILMKKVNLPIFSEEDVSHGSLDNKLIWVVDPLDGSLNYSRNIPLSAVSIALMKNKISILGVIYDFHRKELFSGISNKGAWLNGKKIGVSKTKEKSQAILTTGFPSDTSYKTRDLRKYVSFVQNFKKVRLFGSASLSLAYVACGRVDAYFEKDIKIWDIAAGLAIVKGAGGKCKISKIKIDNKCDVFCTNREI